MATYSCARTIHKTLTSTTVDTVNLTGDVGWLEVINRDTTNRLHLRFDDVDPVADADGTEVVGPGESVMFDNPSRHVRVLGNGGAYDMATGL